MCVCAIYVNKRYFVFCILYLFGYSLANTSGDVRGTGRTHTQAHSAQNTWINELTHTDTAEQSSDNQYNCDLLFRRRPSHTNVYVLCVYVAVIDCLQLRGFLSHFDIQTRVIYTIGVEFGLKVALILLIHFKMLRKLGFGLRFHGF